MRFRLGKGYGLKNIILNDMDDNKLVKLWDKIKFRIIIVNKIWIRNCWVKFELFL